MGANKTFPLNDTELKLFNYLPDSIQTEEKKVIARALNTAVWEISNGLNIGENLAINYIRRLK